MPEVGQLRWPRTAVTVDGFSRRVEGRAHRDAADVAACGAWTDPGAIGWRGKHTIESLASSCRLFHTPRAGMVGMMGEVTRVERTGIILAAVIGGCVCLACSGG